MLLPDPESLLLACGIPRPRGGGGIIPKISEKALRRLRLGKERSGLGLAAPKGIAELEDIGIGTAAGCRDERIPVHRKSWVAVSAMRNAQSRVMSSPRSCGLPAGRMPYSVSVPMTGSGHSLIRLYSCQTSVALVAGWARSSKEDAPTEVEASVCFSCR